jgi:hypothetical protein
MKIRTDKKSQARINVYIPIKDKEVWERALAISDYNSMSEMLRDLVTRFYTRKVKKMAKDCPA